MNESDDSSSSPDAGAVKRARADAPMANGSAAAAATCSPCSPSANAVAPPAFFGAPAQDCRTSPAQAPAQAQAQAPTAPAVLMAPPAPPKKFARAPVPSRVPTDGHHDTVLLRTDTGLGPGEEFSDDERLLNNFLKLHPMLSMEATSNRTLQLVNDMFQRATLKTVDLPIVPKSHDDAMLRIANEAIGERPCINGEKCLARFVAQVRYGLNTPFAFTCTEFLLPADHKKFLAGKGLPSRRGKCLMCLRYFQTYIYVLARTDANFSLENSPLGMQTFCNVVGGDGGGGSGGSGGSGGGGYQSAEASAAVADEEASLREAAANLPTHCSVVSDADGYKPSAMLFVDEDFVNMRTARETKLGTLVWRPVVRFCSSHYKYVMEDGEPHIVQVNIGSNDPTDGLHFGQPPSSAPRVGAAGAKAE